ncbi:MAG: helix-turn-helix domain-containing protein [Sphingomonas sp.]
MAQDDEQLGFEAASVGQRLRAAREARGLGLQDIANQTRIPVRHLHHVEQEEWDDLPGVTYCVGFTRAYAQAVGLDGAEYGREVRDLLGGTRRRTPVAEYYEPADPARVPPRSLAIIALFVGIALVVGYALWRSTLSEVDQPPAAPPPAATEPQQPPPTQTPAAPQAVAGQPVTLVATGEVWLRITDGTSGASLFQGILATGQTFAIPPTAQRPLLRTGRPQLLRASVGGRDLGPLDNTERTVSDVSLRAEDLAARQAQAPR